MNIQESFNTALDSLRANKLRALLTMLGIIIGVAAVIGLLGIGNGFSQFIEGEINSVGTNLIYVVTDEDSSYPTLTMADVDALSNRNQATAVQAVAASSTSGAEVVANGTAQLSSIAGVTDNYFALNNLNNLTAGSLFGSGDVDAYAQVAVLGADVATDLFGDNYAIGEVVTIDDTPYQVVGVLGKLDQGLGGNDNGSVFVPLTTAQQRLDSAETRQGDPALSVIMAQAISEDNVDTAMSQITTILREEHDIVYGDSDDFSLLSQAALVDTFGSITSTLTLFLGAIAGISLLVGGIGIMNIMLVSVTERTREIGIRKALGALRRDILTQFLIESLFLSLLGGVIGIGLGWTVSIVGGNLVNVTALVDWGTVGLAVGFSVAVGLIFGIYPAWRASNLRPIDALRYE